MDRGWGTGEEARKGTYSGSERLQSETAGTSSSGGNRAGLMAVRPLWITSITYLGGTADPAG